MSGAVEPANLHGCVSEFWDEIIYRHSGVAAVDFTLSTGYLAEA